MARGSVFVVLAAVAWGTWSLFVRSANQPGVVAAGLPLLLMGAAAMPLVWLDRRVIRWDRRTLGLVLALGALAAINLWAFFAAIQVTSVAVATLTHYVAPLLIALLAPYFDRERVRGATLAALLGFVGLAVILAPAGLAGSADGVFIGAALGLLSAVAYALLVFTVRRLTPQLGSARVIAYQGLIAGVLLLPMAAHSLGALDWRGFGILGAGAVINGTLAGILFVKGLERIGSSRAAVLTFAEPFTAVMVGWLVWKEPTSWTTWVGSGAIVAAGAWVSWARRRS